MEHAWGMEMPAFAPSLHCLGATTSSKRATTSWVRQSIVGSREYKVLYRTTDVGT